MWNAGLDEVQVRIKISGRNINNRTYADDTTIMAESKEEWKAFFMKMKKSEKTGLKLNIQKTMIIASGSIISWQIDGKIMETETGFIFAGSKITVDGDCSHEIKILARWKKSMTNLDSIFKNTDIANKGQYNQS